jgi:lipopolysaccharide transport system ATP-binding protein
MSENTTSPSATDDVLIRVDNVSKRFCRDLKKSLIYGIQDIAFDLLGRDRSESGLRKSEFLANQGISFELRRGECLGLIGHNGAGKTTLLKMLNGLIKPDTGRIEMHGRIGALIALGAGFNPILTGRENVYIAGSVLGLSKEEIEAKYDEIVEFAELGEFMESPVQNYSSGMQVRLGFAIASQMEPDILLIDEVLAVGDVNFRMKCFSRILKLKDAGVCIILVSHNMTDISRICDKAAVFDKGKLCYLGDVSNGANVYERLMLDAHNDGGGANANDRATIKSVEFIGSDGSNKQSYETGDDVYIKYKIKWGEISGNFRLIVNIFSPRSGHVSSLSNTHVNFTVTEKNTDFVLTLPKIPLLLGTYQINTSIYSDIGDTDFICRRVNIDNLTISQSGPNAFGRAASGLVRLEQEWAAID